MKIITIVLHVLTGWRSLPSRPRVKRPTPVVTVELTEVELVSPAWDELWRTLLELIATPRCEEAA